MSTPSLPLSGIQHAVADSFAGGSVAMWILAHLAQVDLVVQIIAGIATAIAAMVSIIVRFRKRKP